MGPTLGRSLPMEVIEIQFKLAELKKRGNSVALITGTSRDGDSLRHGWIQALKNILHFSLSPLPSAAHQWVLASLTPSASPIPPGSHGNNHQQVNLWPCLRHWPLFWANHWALVNGVQWLARPGLYSHPLAIE